MKRKIQNGFAPKINIGGLSQWVKSSAAKKYNSPFKKFKVIAKPAVFLTACVAFLTSQKMDAADCILLKFPACPSPAMIEHLADTQNAQDRQLIRNHFLVKHETGFILSSVHTNEIAEAMAEGATRKTLHESHGGNLLANFGKH
jgi:hypothetical protein